MNKISACLAVLLIGTMIVVVVPAVEAQHSVPAIWVDPSALNFDTAHTSVGDKFNVTVWAGTAGDAFTYQAEVLFNVTQLQAVRAAYTNLAGSMWFKGHTSVPSALGIDNTHGTVVGGETLLGLDAVHASSGSLFWVEFQIVTAPTPGTTLTSLIDTNDTFASFLLDPNLNDLGALLDHATYTFSGGAPPSPRHDVAILSVSPSSPSVKQNETISIDVMAMNNGTLIETFDVNVTYDGNLIGTKTVTALTAGATVDLNFTWQPSGVAPASYTIKATAAAVAGEVDLPNNVKTASVRVLSTKGLNTDVNGDGVVNMRDIGIVGRAFGTSQGEPDWNPAADVNGDGVVDLFDVALVARDFWKH